MRLRERLALFTPVEERLSLWLPLALLPVAALEAALSRRLFPHLSPVAMGVLLHVLFLNTLHNAFTFSMLAGMPELRAWARARPGGAAGFWLGQAAMAAFLFSLFVWAGGLMSPEGGSSLVLALMVADASAQVQHSTAQWKGLSLAYNAKARAAGLSPEQEREVESSESSERRWFDLYVLGAVALSFWFWLRLPGAWRPDWLSPAPSWVGALLVAATALSAAGVFAAAWRSPVLRGTGKPLFLGRLAYYPLAPFSFTAFVVPRLIHGVEYLFVCRAMAARSSAGGALLAWTGLLVAACAVPMAVKLRWLDAGRWQTVLAAASLTATFMHFHLDAVLFRMRDRRTREAVAPLLVG